MKQLSKYLAEKLIINKDYRDNTIVVKSFVELKKIIDDRYDKLGPGTEQNPIDFNDIDVSNIDSFYNYNKDKGIFDGMHFKYIDISGWNVSNAESMQYMFFECSELKSVGDISSWDVSKVTNMNSMFYRCKKFNQDISGWDVSKVSDMGYMFGYCESFNKNISSWDVSSVTDMSYMFYDCENFNQDLSGWDVSNVRQKDHMFYICPIKNEYKPKFKQMLLTIYENFKSTYTRETYSQQEL